MSLDVALKEADELDLVEMSVQNGISICKVMDYRKFIYDQKKKGKQVKQKELKEIKIRPNIEIHDLKIKAKKASELLNEGHKVKLSVIYRGRERSQINNGIEIVKNFVDNLSTTINTTKEPKIEGNAYTLILEK